MRTKTILLTAAVLSAGLAASVAQSVFSVNAVGYVNKSFPIGRLAVVANPLNNGNNQVNTVLPVVPDNTLLYRFNSSAGTYFDAESFAGVGFGWFTGGGDPSTTVIAPGEGFFLAFPDANPVTITFVGDVPQSSTQFLSNNIPSGYSMRSSQVPQSLGLSAMGIPVEPDDLVYFWNYAGQSWNAAISYVSSGQWVDGDGNFPVDPTPAVAEGFFIAKAHTAAWTRTFNVN